MFLYFLALTVGVVLLFYAFTYLYSPKALKLEGGHVFITGGSSGIGKALAIEAVKHGAHVTIVARNKTRLEEAAKEIKQHTIKESQKVTTLSLDITKDISGLTKAVSMVEADVGPVDVLFNCAGFAISKTFEDTTIEDFKNLMELNYFGSVNTTKCVLPSMKRRRHGQIVFISSIAGQIGLFGYTAYTGSKFALNGLAQALHMETKPYNVYVSVAFPPDTDTPGFAQENISKPEETKLISEAAGLHDPTDVASAILQGVKQRKFCIGLGIDGLMLGSVSSGMSPVTRVSDALLQVATMSLFRLIGLGYIFSFDRIVAKCMAKKKT